MAPECILNPSSSFPPQLDSMVTASSIVGRLCEMKNEMFSHGHGHGHGHGESVRLCAGCGEDGGFPLPMTYLCRPHGFVQRRGLASTTSSDIRCRERERESETVASKVSSFMAHFKHLWSSRTWLTDPISSRGCGELHTHQNADRRRYHTARPHLMSHATNCSGASDISHELCHRPSPPAFLICACPDRWQPRSQREKCLIFLTSRLAAARATQMALTLRLPASLSCLGCPPSLPVEYMQPRSSLSFVPRSGAQQARAGRGLTGLSV